MIPFFTTLFAWFFQSFTGFGAGIFIVGFLSLFYNPKEVIVSSAVANLIGTLLILIQNRKGKVNPSLLISLILFSIPGIYIGSYLLSIADKDTLKLVIGIFIIVLGFYDYMQQKGKLSFKLGKPLGPLAGFLGGLSAGLVGLGGPPPAIYLNQNTNSIQSFKLMLNIYFTSNIVFRLLFYHQESILYLNKEIIIQCMLGVPFGVLLGGLLSKKVTKANFKSIVSLSVLVLGFLVIIL